MKTIAASFALAAFACFAQETPPGGVRATFQDGTVVEFETTATGPQAQGNGAGSVTPEKNRVLRVVTDRNRRVLFAYLVEAWSGSALQSYIRIRPLDAAAEAKLRANKAVSIRRSAKIPTLAAVREFPVLTRGEAVSVDILQNPSTGAKIVDVLRLPVQKAPPEVEQALRARIGEFYQLHVAGQFRKAEALVAEDTKDFFFASNKPRYAGFEIRTIDFSNNFTRAKALVLCEQQFLAPGFTDAPVKAPIPSTWKLENGQWFWYVDQDAFRTTPFGTFRTVEPGAAPQRRPPSMPTAAPTDPTPFLHKVTADRQSLTLKPGESATVTFSNSAQGVMSLMLAGEAPTGLEITPRQFDLKAGEKAAVTFKATIGGVIMNVVFRVVSTGEGVAIAVKTSN